MLISTLQNYIGGTLVPCRGRVMKAWWSSKVFLKVDSQGHDVEHGSITDRRGNTLQDILKVLINYYVTCCTTPKDNSHNVVLDIGSIYI